MEGLSRAENKGDARQSEAKKNSEGISGVPGVCDACFANQNKIKTTDDGHKATRQADEGCSNSSEGARGGAPGNETELCWRLTSWPQAIHPSTHPQGSRDAGGRGPGMAMCRQGSL